jgi:hypothetical protein
MIKRRLSLGFSLLWRTYVVYFIYSGVLGLAFGRLVLISSDFLRFASSIALGLFALLLAILEAGCRINVRRTVEALSGAMANLRSSTLTGVGRAGHLERPAGVFCAG